MRVAMVCGEPTIACGVADYTGRLITALERAGLEVSLLASERWGYAQAGGLQKRLEALRPDRVHVQYPAAVYGKGLAPQALVMRSVGRWPTAVTLHEFSQAHPLRKLADVPFAFAHHIVFTSAFEQAAFHKLLPFAARRSSVIPLGSSIPFLPDRPSDGRTVVYFGLIRPEKGLEDFLELARLSLERGRNYRFTILGTVHINAAAYLAHLQGQAQSLTNLEWVLEQPADAVASRLATARFAYLPFPDGASERRTSLLSAMGNGVAVITTRGSQTPADLQRAVSFAASPEEALACLERLEANPDEEAQQLARSKAYAVGFGWEAVASAHADLYERLREVK